MALIQFVCALLLMVIQALIGAGQVSTGSDAIPFPDVEWQTVQPARREAVRPTTTTTQVVQFEGEGWVEPRYDLDPLPGIENARCGDWWQMAVDEGWPIEWLPKLDRIMWDESNCLHDVVSRTNDYGLVQINWHAHGSRLTDKGISREDLLRPDVNLREGLWIAQYAAEHYGCWHQPWYMSGNGC